ncbi:serine hydrolase domain-containing protein [Rhizobium sp. YIM 134829]|uniref:serine hydrolase domain-containing protein n=1 Tax=Rhizobium sp. YIM 134829 TaxID=3390453 RepID=UPI00397A5551
MLTYRSIVLAVSICFSMTWGVQDLAFAAESCGVPSTLSDHWPTAPAVEEGFDSAALCALVDLMSDRASVLSGIHGVLVARRGKLVFETYRTGFDHPWGKPAGTYAYDAATPHDVRSIAKSVVSLLIGVAVDRHLIRSLDDAVFDYLPQYRDLRTTEKAKITIRTLLSMTSGLVTNEDTSYADPDNTERLMAEAADPYRWVLERKVLHEPGTHWAYSSGNTMLLSAVLQTVTAMTLDAFAREALFEPMGISSAEWIRLRRSGEFAAYGGLRMRPRDVATLGQFLLDHGKWDGKQIVSKEWMAESTRLPADRSLTDRYALLWWKGRSKRAGNTEVAWTAAYGIGGQRLYAVPDLDLIVVIMAGLYDHPQQDEIVRSVLEDYILASLK